MMRAAACGFASFALMACGQTYQEKRAEALASEPVIAPGIYGNVRLYSAPAIDEGMEIELRQGSDSAEVRAVLCEVACQAVAVRAVRRGLGGVSFTMPTGNELVDVSVRADGADAVIITADWGEGLQDQRLSRLDRPFALDIDPDLRD